KKSSLSMVRTTATGCCAKHSYMVLRLTASPLQSRRSLCLKRHGSAATQVPCRGVAQLVEYRSPKPVVAGSSPAAPANFNPLISQPTIAAGRGKGLAASVAPYLDLSPRPQ